ncbi:MAG: hypothetical protein EXR86_11815 [Gammaproteobacteria bacterium]|nr:hypothetical protein [Gammaproteobacteria bacterium]
MLLFLGLLCIALNFLYKQGRITSDKMEMQNAADAIAYSISVTEARDLNFAAYLNRAMVANEVAIGQLMGLVSWAFHWNSFADFLMFYDTTVIGPSTLGISTPIMQTITNAMFRIPAQSFFIPFLSALARIGTTALHVINKFYGLAQFGYHTVTAIFSIGVINEMLEQNAPAGARISEFGIASLIPHFASYGSIALPVPGGTFTTSYSPTKTVPRAEYDAGDKGEIEGYERFASLIRDSRDPFTMQRGWEFGLFTLPPVKDGINEIGQEKCLDPVVCGSAWVDDDGALHFKLGYDWDLALFGVEWSIEFYFGINLEREGGSELRLLPQAATVSGADFNWSSADTTVLAAMAGGAFDIRVLAPNIMVKTSL